jgi:Gas vesicle synthesis protein GvpL/GvpF
MKLYVYCLADIDAFPPDTTGLEGRKLTLMTVDDLSVVVSAFDGDAVPVTRDHILRHEAVVRSILERTTPLPFRFGTLVTEQQLHNYLTTRRTDLETKLANVRGCAEMNVKIIWNQSLLRKNLEASEQGYGGERMAKLGAGAAFLFSKQREAHGNRFLADHAAELASWLKAQVAGLVRAEQVTVRPNEKLVLAAAHLVERELLQPYRQKVSEAFAEKPELHFMQSGPWPPYSFANIDLEFKTPFGVS